jgi:LTXXQ motif family protein
VKGILLAGAIAATAALAGPVLAQPAENAGAAPSATAPADQQGQSGGAQAGQAQGGMQRGGGAWMQRGGGWAMQGWPMMRQMMMRRMWMMRMNPKDRCIDRLAWRAAREAYVEAKLGLTQQQQPLWDKVQSISQAEQHKERALCLGLKPRGQSTLLDRMDQAQQFLSVRLDALHQATPAVQALYQALTPEQQGILNHPFRP